MNTQCSSSGIAYSPDMETFTEEKSLVSNPGFAADREKALEELRVEISRGSIDEPTMDVLQQFSRIPCCYTLQSCYGHFMLEQRTEDRNANRVAAFGSAVTKLHYRIAYVAFCVENSLGGRKLLEDLKSIPKLDTDYIQFGSADWFWNQCVNSFVLQVSPLKNACEDHFDVSIEDSLHIEKTRDGFFDTLRGVLSRSLMRDGRELSS